MIRVLPFALAIVGCTSALEDNLNKTVNAPAEIQAVRVSCTLRGDPDRSRGEEGEAIADAYGILWCSVTVDPTVFDIPGTLRVETRSAVNTATARVTFAGSDEHPVAAFLPTADYATPIEVIINVEGADGSPFVPWNPAFAVRMPLSLSWYFTIDGNEDLGKVFSAELPMQVCEVRVDTRLTTQHRWVLDVPHYQIPAGAFAGLDGVPTFSVSGSRDLIFPRVTGPVTMLLPFPAPSDQQPWGISSAENGIWVTTAYPDADAGGVRITGSGTLVVTDDGATFEPAEAP